MIHLKRLYYGIVVFGAFAIPMVLLVTLGVHFPRVVPVVLLMTLLYCLGGAVVESREGK